MLKKRCLLIITLSLLFILLTVSVNSQVSVMLSQPLPNQWHVEDMWQLNLTSTTNTDLEVYLYATIEENDAGIIFEATSASFILAAYYSGPVNRGDLEPVDVEYNSDYEDIIQRTGTLPAGNYTICVYVKSLAGDDMGHDCIMQIIAHSSPPEQISPFDETTVTEELLVFLWLPPMPMGDFVTYNIKLVELLDGQIPIEAMEANPAFYIEEDISATSFQYPISAREFEQGVTYAWNVTAISDDGFMIGESQTWSFTYGAAAVVTYSAQVSIELVSPSNGEVYDSPASQPLVMFEWASIDFPLNTEYIINIWSVSDSLNLEVLNKMKSGVLPLNNILIKSETVKDNRIEIELETGNYAWQVQALELSGSPLGGNDGKSEINSFTCTSGQISTCINSTWKFKNLQPNYDDCENFRFFVAKAWQCKDGKWVEKISDDLIQAKKVKKLPDDAEYCDWYTIRVVEWIYKKELKKEESNIIYNTYHRGEKEWDPPIEIKFPKVGVEDDLTMPCKDCDERFEILENPPEEKDNKVRAKCKRWHCKNGEFVFEGEQFEEFEIVTELPDKWRHCQKVALIEKKPGKRIYHYYHCDHGTWEKIKTIEVGTTIAHIFKIKGRVRVKRAGSKKWIRAKKCMRLREGAVIESQLGGRAYIKFLVEGKRVGTAVIKQLTQMTIKKFNFNKKKVNITLKIRVGSVRVRVDKTALRTDMQVSTPSMGGVVGSSFEVSHNDTTNTSVLVVFDGSVDVTNLKTKETVVITGDGKGNGQRATVQGDKIIVEDIKDMDASPGGEWDFDAMFEE